MLKQIQCEIYLRTFLITSLETYENLPKSFQSQLVIQTKIQSDLQMNGQSMNAMIHKMHGSLSQSPGRAIPVLLHFMCSVQESEFKPFDYLLLGIGVRSHLLPLAFSTFGW